MPAVRLCTGFVYNQTLFLLLSYIFVSECVDWHLASGLGIIVRLVGEPKGRDGSDMPNPLNLIQLTLA